MKLINQELQKIIHAQIERLGYILWGIELIPTKYSYLARVYIDKPNGVGIEDCALVNRSLDLCLIEENIGLEVSSPGLKRKFFSAEQYKDYIGQTVKIKTKKPIEGQRNFMGDIFASNDDCLFISCGDNKKEFKHIDIEVGQLEPDYRVIFRK